MTSDSLTIIGSIYKMAIDQKVSSGEQFCTPNWGGGGGAGWSETLVPVPYTPGSHLLGSIYKMVIDQKVSSGERFYTPNWGGGGNRGPESPTSCTL